VLPINVAVICFSRAWGGLELKLIELAQALQSSGHHIVVVAPPESPISTAAAAAGMSTISVKPYSRYLDVIAAWRIVRRLRSFQIGTLLVGQSRDVSTSLLVKRLLGHCRLVFFQQMQFGLPKRDPFHRWAYGGVDRWITLTASMRDAVLSFTTFRPERISVVPMGSDLSRFDPSHYRQAKARADFGLPSKKVIVAVIGRIDPQKGQEVLLRSIPGLLSKKRDLLFLIVGEETKGELGYRQRLDGVVEELNIGASVRILPFTRDIPRLLAAIDLLVLPSLNESFGYVAVEAMAMGKPVVGTNAGGVPEIIEDGLTGYLVPPGDPEALGRKVFEILARPARYRSMSRLARKRALERFDLSRQLPTIESLLAGS